jgi:hypothetical protein
LGAAIYETPLPLSMLNMEGFLHAIPFPYQQVPFFVLNIIQSSDPAAAAAAAEAALLPAAAAALSP